MTEYTLSKQDIRDAESFLSKFQEEQVPEASLQLGGAVRDLLVKGFAALYAYLRGEIDAVAAKQSLLRLQEVLTDDVDIRQSVDEIISNWFLTRRGGQYSIVTARLHFTSRSAVAIPLNSKFWRTNTLIYYIDSTSDPYMISANQMIPVFGSDGVLVDYIADVPLKASRTGAEYDVPAGTFVRLQIPGGLPYFRYAENVEPGSGGKDLESTEEVLERAQTAISVRNLVNNRSCDVVLGDKFPAITDTQTLGMGEPEMVRDLITDIAPHIQLHAGGHYDTYIEAPLVSVEEILTVGGYFSRPDGKVVVFRDPELTYDKGHTFTSLGIVPGHVLFIRDGIAGSQRGYSITGVADHALYVSENTAFLEASDELQTNAVEYSIGWYSPAYEDIDLENPAGVHFRTASASLLPAYAHVPYGTSRKMQEPGTVVLSGKPIQDITWVELTNPTGAMSNIVDPATGTILFSDRVNGSPQQVIDPAYVQYQLVIRNPTYGQSMLSIPVLRVGYPTILQPVGDIFDGKNLRVRYTTVADFSNIHAYVRNRDNRVVSANHLIKARHPVWVRCTIPYRRKPAAQNLLDESEAATFLAKHINQFDFTDNLDMSDLATALRNEYEDIIGTVFPFDIYYHLESPDGQQAYFTTSDIVSIFEDSDHGVVLTNGSEITPSPSMISQGITSIQSSTQLRSWFAYLGISDRTVVYRTKPEYISFMVRS